MSSNDQTLPRTDNDYDPARAGLDRDDSLTSLLATAAGAVHVDRQLTQRCILRAAMLLELEITLQGDATAQATHRPGGLVAWQVNRLKTYIDDKLNSSIRSADLAELVRLSTGHFHRAFRNAFGESPIAYVIKQRVRRAQKLMLSDSRVSLSQVALECGMCDQAHFSRTFRRVVGTTPSAWRRHAVGLRFSVGHDYT